MTLRLAGYELGGLLGAGSFGSVYEAKAPWRAAPVAIKLLTHSPHVERAFAELHTLARLDHPHIVAVLDSGQVGPGLPWAETTPWFAMELASHTLSAVQLTSFDEVHQLLEQVLRGLAHLHAHEVIHRDLKPDNILRVGADPRWVLADLGVALGTGEVVGLRYTGSPQYSAPEQFEGAEGLALGPGTDLYGLGCVAWQLLTGHPPFEGWGGEGLVRQHREAALPEFRPRMACPSGVAEWLGWLLRKRPEERFPHAAAARFALASAVNTPPMGAVEGPGVASVAYCPTVDASLTAEADPAPAALLEPPTQTLPFPACPRPARLGHRRAPCMAGLITPPPLGREGILERLWRALGEVRASGDTQLVWLEGEAAADVPGLVSWLGRAAAERGLARLVVSTHDGSYGRHTGWLGALRRVYRVGSASHEELVARLRHRVAEPEAVAELLGPAPPVRWLLTMPAVRAAAHEAVAGLCRHQALIWLLRDLAHQSLDLSEVMRQMQAVKGLPVLLVVTGRPGDYARCAAQGYASEEAVAWRARVPVLAPQRRGEQVRSYLHLTAELEARVVARSGGSADYVQQLARDLSRRQALVPTPEGWTYPAPLPQDLPQLWEAALARVVAGGHPSWTRALVCGAMFGLAVDEQLWGAAAPVPRRSELLRRLQDEGLLLSLGSWGWRWSHQAFREHVLQRAEDLVEVAGTVAAALEAVEGSSAARARLWLEAGEPDRALRATSELVSRTRPLDKVRIHHAYELCQEVARRWPGAPSLPPVVAELGRSLLLIKDHRTAQVLDWAGELAARSGVPEHLALWGLVVGRSAYLRREPEEAERRLLEALRTLGDRDPRLQNTLLVLITQVLAEQRRPECVGYARQAIAEASHGDDVNYARVILAYAMGQLERYAEGLRVLEEARPRLETWARPEGRAMYLQVAAGLWSARGEHGESVRANQASVAIRDRLGWKSPSAAHNIALSMLRLHTEEPVDLAEVERWLYRYGPGRSPAAMQVATELWLRAAQGRLQEAHALLDALEEELKERRPAHPLRIWIHVAEYATLPTALALRLRALLGRWAQLLLDGAALERLRVLAQERPLG